MVLGKLPVPGRPTIWITVGQGPTAFTEGAGEGCLDIFTLIYPFFPLSPSLWETARYRLKYCLKNNQPTNLNGSTVRGYNSAVFIFASVLKSLLLKETICSLTSVFFPLQVQSLVKSEY